MAITSAMTDLVKSAGELLSSVLNAAYAIVHSFVSGLLGLFAGFFAFVGDVGKGVLDLAGGVGNFVAGMYCTSHSILFFLFLFFFFSFFFLVCRLLSGLGYTVVVARAG